MKVEWTLSHHVNVNRASFGGSCLWHGAHATWEQPFLLVLVPSSCLQSHSLSSEVDNLLVEIDADSVHVRRCERLGHEPLGYGGFSNASFPYSQSQIHYR